MRVNYVGVRCTGCGVWYAALKAVAAEVTDADTTASFVYQRKVRGLEGFNLVPIQCFKQELPTSQSSSKTISLNT
jgi:hypothetical protein